jgi:ribosomal protein S18 acetylase RimI-like enzyme
MDLEFKQAAAGDSAWLFDTYRQTMRDFVTAVYGWNEETQRAGFAKSMRQGCCQIVICEGKCCGFVHWEVEPDLVWLRMLCIVPEMQRQSIGSSALTKVMSLSAQLHKPLYLHVFTGNGVACDWYKKIGFVEVENDEGVCVMVLDTSSVSGASAQANGRDAGARQRPRSRPPTS